MSLQTRDTAKIPICRGTQAPSWRLNRLWSSRGRTTKTKVALRWKRGTSITTSFNLKEYHPSYSHSGKGGHQTDPGSHSSGGLVVTESAQHGYGPFPARSSGGIGTLHFRLLA